MKYLVDFRLRKVAEYLVTTTLSLPEIAQKSGFNGTSYMAEMFKRTFGGFSHRLPENTPRAVKKQVCCFQTQRRKEFCHDGYQQDKIRSF